MVNAPICDTLKTLKEHSLRKPSYGFFRGYKTRTLAKIELIRLTDVINIGATKHDYMRRFARFGAICTI